MLGRVATEVASNPPFSLLRLFFAITGGFSFWKGVKTDPDNLDRQTQIAAPVAATHNKSKMKGSK
jgi:hypothetical protein